MKYLHKLTIVVEKKVAERLPDKFAIIFDGWSGGDTHFVGVYATFPSNNSLGYEKILLSCSPMENEDFLDSNEHYEYLKFVLDLYGKNIDSVVEIVGDNCSTNRCMSRIIGPIFVGCHSHRFNLALKDIISKHQVTVDAVQALMKKLSYQIPTTKLRKLTHLKAIQDNVTRCSYTFKMLKRYMEIREFIGKLNDDDVLDLLPRKEEKKRIGELLKILEVLARCAGG
ncbi:MAG: hypothetical protein AAGC43_18510 [Bacteroidota bacterium]